MNRRDLLKAGLAGLALGVSPFPLGWTARADAPRRRLLMFTRSQGFEHSVVKRGKNDEPSLAERIVTDMSKKHGFEVTCTKDGRVFTPENIHQYDAFLFETTGDLTQPGGDHQPPMSPEGKHAFLKAIAEGKGFVGCHCASDTFHSPGQRDQTQPPDQRDPYIQMLGGEFIIHGEQQKAKMIAADSHFGSIKDLKDFEKLEEWYALKNFATDLHVILVQDTSGMKKEKNNWMYNRPNYPATWARHDNKGRVFYTSMGHREDVWESHTFHAVLLGGLAWAFGNVDADTTPNIEKVTPKANDLPTKK
ncbi:MAG TPA: ThuA domain-containing protein [Gemmataceae bacterium]|nr:ThuA domain-containing protein [Gemmataceae bacterium]